jgi:capsular exopolysaccharide synthesis family protein
VTLAQYLRILRQQWLVVVLLATVALAGAAAYTFRQTPTYSATTKLFISVSSASDISQLSLGSTFTGQRVKSYADVVTSPSVLEQVIGQLHLPETADALAGEVTVDSPLDTVLLDVTVTDANPQRAADIANSIAQQFPLFVTQLETSTGQGESPVKVSVTDRAAVPTSPVSPRVPLNLALGLLVGLGLGVGAAVLRDQLNTSVDGIEDVERLTGSIPLGVVPYDARASKQPLVDVDQHTHRAEAFRTLRTNLQFVDVDHPPRVIVVTSALPAEGKTTSACNVALTLALGGARVVLVDGDLRQPTVGEYLGISSAAGLTSVLAGQHQLADVVVSYGRQSLSVLPSGPAPPNPSELLGSKQMEDLIFTLANRYDVVVIDAPPLLPVTDAAVLAAASDGAVLVIRHGRTRREEVQRAVQALGAVNGKLLGTVLNFAPKRKRGGGYDGYGYGYGYGDTAVASALVPSGSVGRRQAIAEPHGMNGFGAEHGADQRYAGHTSLNGSTFTVNGVNGMNGMPSTDGVYGANGTPGANEPYGSNGFHDANGRPGAQGPYGSNGFHSANGTPSANGLHGSNEVHSVNGTTGGGDAPVGERRRLGRRSR